MNINVKDIENIKDRLDSLNDDDVLFIDEDGISKYAIINIKTYDKVEDILNALSSNPLNAEVKVIGPKSELTYEEYERIKDTIMEAVEKTFMPKAGKLN